MEKSLRIKTKAKVENKSFELEEELEPASPTSEYFLSEFATLYVLTVLELEIPVNGPNIYDFFNGVFLNSHPRFSSIPVKGENGKKFWKRVKVNVEDHIMTPKFPEGLSPENYSEHLDDYISKIATSNFLWEKPLWEVHVFDYPTKNSASTLLFRIHHAVGDGTSIMGLVLTCFRRVDDPTLPPSLPTRTRATSKHEQNAITTVINTFKLVPSFIYSMFTSVYDFGQIVRVVLFQDDRTPIRSGKTYMLQPYSANIFSVTFSLNEVKRIKSILNVTVNDVVIGLIAYATRLYNHEMDEERSKNSRMTASIAFNIRSMRGYASPEEMRKGNTWGNKISIIEIPLPKLNEDDLRNPLSFVIYAHNTVKRKMKSIGAIYFAAWALEAIRKYRGFKAAAIVFERTWKHSTFMISNLAGPTQQSTVGNHPIKGIYFIPTGLNLSLTVSVLTYMDDLRIGLAIENGYVDRPRLIGCVENAYRLILQAATDPLKSTL